MNRRSILVTLVLPLVLIFPLAGVAEAKKDPGAIAGTVAVTCGADAAGVFVYIPGRSFVAITGPSGDFELSGVPPGSYTLRLTLASPADALDVPGVTVKPGKTTNVGVLTLGPDLQTDPQHCGACAIACAAGQACTAGQCTSACGDGIVAPGEQCDGGDLHGQTCATQGFGGGTLACTASCTFNTTGCTTCGNGVLETGEQCEGANLNGQTCLTRGFDGGALSCTSSCTFDTAGCIDCQPGQSLCAAVCVNLQTNLNHCGACFNQCAPLKPCLAGLCSP